MPGATGMLLSLQEVGGGLSVQRSDAPGGEGLLGWSWDSEATVPP